MLCTQYLNVKPQQQPGEVMDKQKQTQHCKESNLLKFTQYYNKQHTSTKGEVFTLKSCVQLYYKKHLTRLKKSTQQAVKAKSDYFLKTPISHLPLENISAKKIDLWLEWLKAHKTAKNKSRLSFCRELNILHSILNWYKNYIDETFIVPILKRHKVLCKYKPLTHRRADYFARPEELHMWIGYLQKKKKDPVYWRLAQLLVLTGLRVGEAAGLLWSDVNLKKKYLNITKTLGWDYHTREPYISLSPKNFYSIRKIYLPNIIIKMFTEMKTEQECLQSDHIFVSYKKKLLKYSLIQTHFNTGFQACNLPWRSTHICRHSYATMALMATKNLTIVQACLGHSSQKTTERYAKVMTLMNTNVAEEVASFWEKHGQ